jgi:hypothetical protein
MRLMVPLRHARNQLNQNPTLAEAPYHIILNKRENSEAMRDV